MTLITAQFILPGTLRPGVLYRPSQRRCSRCSVCTEDLHQSTNFSRCLGLVYMGWVTSRFHEVWSDNFPPSRYELPFGVENRTATDPTGGVPTAVSFDRLFPDLD